MTVNQSDDLYLVDLWRVISRSKGLIASAIAITTTVSVAVAFLMQPVYRTEILLAAVEENRDPGGLGLLAQQFGGAATLAGMDLSAGGRKSESVAVLKSRKFTQAFVNDNNLMPVLFADDWNESTEEWKAPKPEDRPTIEDAYKLFDEEIRFVRIDRDTGLVTLSIEWKDRQLAAHWANSLVAGINEHLRSRAISEAQTSLVFLKKELDKTSILGLQQGLFRLIEDEVKSEMLANVREQYAFRVIDPAVVPDADDFQRPKRAFIVAIGFLLGLFLGLFVAVFRGFISGQRASAF